MGSEDKTESGSPFNQGAATGPFKADQDNLLGRLSIADLGKYGQDIGQPRPMAEMAVIEAGHDLPLVKNDQLTRPGKSPDRIDKDDPAPLLQQGQEIEAGQSAFAELYPVSQGLQFPQAVKDRRSGGIFRDQAVADTDDLTLHRLHPLRGGPFGLLRQWTAQTRQGSKERTTCPASTGLFRSLIGVPIRASSHGPR